MQYLLILSASEQAVPYEIVGVLEQKEWAFAGYRVQPKPVLMLTSSLLMGKPHADAELCSSAPGHSSCAGIEKGFVAMPVGTRITVVSIAQHLLFHLKFQNLAIRGYCPLAHTALLSLALNSLSCSGITDSCVRILH